MAAEAQKDLMSCLEILFTQGVWSDLTINCQGDSYKVHKAIVCPRSAFFKRACAEGRFKEGETGVIDLDEDDRVSVKLMVHYLYHLDYPHQPKELGSLKYLKFPITQTQGTMISGAGLTPAAFSWLTGPPGLTLSPSISPPEEPSQQPSTETSQVCPNLTVHAKVYALAEQYGIPSLKAVALDKFKREAGRFWLTNDFLDAAVEVYTSTIEQDRGLQDIVAEAIHKHAIMMDLAETKDTVENDQTWLMIL